MIALKTASDSGEPSVGTRIRSICSFIGHLSTAQVEQPPCQPPNGGVPQKCAENSSPPGKTAGRRAGVPAALGVAPDLHSYGVLLLRKATPMVKKILTALDGSKTSESSLPYL